MIRSRTAVLVATGAFAAGLGPGVPAARAADADASAIGVGPDASAVFVGGSAQLPDGARSGVAGRWNLARGRFDWLERVPTDGLTAIVPAGSSVYGIGGANGQLAVASLDPSTGRLRRACGPTGVRLSSLGPPVLPSRAVAAGGDLVVAGATLSRPRRGFVAQIDGGTCGVLRSTLVGARGGGIDVGFTGLDLDAGGNPVASGSSGPRAAIFRFDPGLLPRGSRTFDLGGTGFSDVKATADGGVAVGVSGSRLLAQCFRLPSLSPDRRCGRAGLRALRFPGGGVPAGGATLGRLPSGSWLVAGSSAGRGGPAASRLRPALGAFEPGALDADPHVLAPAATRVLDPFPAASARFSAVTATSTAIAGVGAVGAAGARRPFLFASRLDGTRPTFTPLTGLDAAPPAPLEPAPAPPPPATAAPPPAAAVPPVQARFERLAGRPAADGTFGFVTLSCRLACVARGSYTAPLHGTHRPLGATTARLAAGWRLRVRLALTRRGLRTLGHARRLRVTVRFAVADAAGGRQLVRRTLILRARGRP